TLACQMNPADVERTTLEVVVKESGKDHAFGASGKTILFPGFLRVYVEGSDDPEADLGDRETILPEVAQGDVLPCKAVNATEHETRPPARYTEASLVRKLEDDGVGRPSTYASIIGTIQDRGYIFKKGNELVPSFTAFAVIGLLEDNFGELVDLQFTARMEDELDGIAEGRGDMVSHLRKFYSGDHGLAKEVETRSADIPFPVISLGDGIVVRIGRNGPFVQRGEGGAGNTASIPEDMPPAELNYAVAEELLQKKGSGGSTLATDPTTGNEVVLKSGRFGAYLEQMVDGVAKRVTLPPGETADSLNAEDVGTLFTFPRILGKNANGDEVTLAVGRYGAYLSAGEQKANVGDWRASTSLSLESALETLANPPNRRGGGERKPIEPLSELGTHPDLAGPVKVMSGRFGPYVTDGKTNATIARGLDPKTITMEQAVELIKARMAAGPPVKRGRFGKKTTAKKAPAKKAAPKKKK
ncbi:MAG: topoisomerase C-terminal repeat-containing protein, partial [Armatimonadota bacterium]